MNRILITPLDWGLGHATRCIPIIRYLLSIKCDVFIGSSGRALQLLKIEFPDLQFFDLPAYAPTYSKSSFMVWKMGLQLPKFIRAISSEHEAVEKIVREHNIDVVISDNRYGCWSAAIPSVFITHQSNILMPKRFGWMSRWIRIANESLINKFQFCWIPDYPDDHSLAGELISFGNISFHADVKYIGSLSRFVPQTSSYRYDVVAIISGPEPQRSILEQMLTDQLDKSGLKFLLIQGRPDRKVVHKINGQAEIVNFLTSEQLQEILPSANVIIARSGYSTIMDMKALERKVIFIPTPGQTEQEYLASRLKEKGVAYYMDQHKFDLALAMKESKAYMGFRNSSEKNNLLMDAFQSLRTFSSNKEKQ
ncbi:MAG TPA: glycosyltransferase [Ohtaekwangia sp.]|nr:glycosyltransferase [Ohtaekwangia sp.]